MVIHKHQLRQCGDVQLWVVISEKAGFEIPIYATPHNHVDHPALVYWLVKIAVPVPEEWRVKCDKLLFGFRENYEPEDYFLTEASLMEIAEKAPGITPAYYLHLATKAPAINMEEQAKKIRRRQTHAAGKEMDFLDFITTRSDIKPEDRTDLIYFWKLITSAIPYYLVQKEKPVPFGCFTLHAVPLRADWVMRWAWLHPEYITRGTFSMDEEDVKLIASTQHLKAMDNSSHYCRWSLMAVPEQKFWEASNGRESKERRTSGINGYAVKHQNLLVRLKQSLHECLYSFRKQAAFPMAHYYTSGVRGGTGYIPRAVCVGDFPKIKFPHLGNYPQGANVTPKPVVEKNETLPTMPVLPPPREDVRETGRDMVQREDETGGEVGVRLRDVPEGEAGGRGLLESEHGTSDRVAG
jgi:hypothetical protein